MVRSILAVLAGMILWAGLWVGGNAVLRGALPDAYDAEGLTRSVAVLSLILVLSVVLSVIAGYLTAAIAGRRAILHAFVFGAVQLAIGVGVQAAVWQQMPLWYHLSFLALLIPASLLGGALRAGGSAMTIGDGVPVRA